MTAILFWAALLVLQIQLAAKAGRLVLGWLISAADVGRDDRS